MNLIWCTIKKCIENAVSSPTCLRRYPLPKLDDVLDCMLISRQCTLGRTSYQMTKTTNNDNNLFIQCFDTWKTVIQITIF